MRGHLPPETSSFVGRRAELATVERAMTSHRLVTLTGTGGVGKTRLALRVASRTADRFPDGTWWADLSALDGDRLLVTVVADAVDLSDHTPRPIEALSDWLAPRRLLLVLDSCEHLAHACGQLVAELLTAAPGLTVLATSRQPLQLPAEHVYEVEPLRADGPDALELFSRRMTDAQHSPAGASGVEPNGAVAEICRRLEGIPLALELAAAQVHQYGVEGVRAQLDSRFDVLARSEDVWPRRHRTLRTAVGWSHELCEPLERLLWARLTVFRAGFDPASASEVCSGGPLTEAAVPGLLNSLVAKSVVRRDGRRYRMLDTIREYGAAWLQALGEHDAVSDRHAELCLRLARQAEAGWLSADQARWYGRIQDAHTELCTALDHLLTARPGQALELAGTTGFFWACCGHLHEARGYLEHALARSQDPGPHRVRALWALGVALTLQGEYDAAQRLSERCVQAARREGSADDTLDAAYLTGLIALLTGRPQTAHRTVDALLHTQPGTSPAASAPRLRCHLVKVFALTGMGRLTEAREEAHALRRLCVALGERWTRAYLDYQLAVIALLQADPERAVEHARAMLVGKRGLGDSFGLALGLDVLAAGLAAQGEGERAAHVFGTSEAFWRSTGHPQRGTPELRPVREECERAARATAGDQAYEDAFRRGASGAPQAELSAVLALGGRSEPPPR
ncbi:ATP-binding protein [Streptomyces sp. SYSU K21746]